jgi:hypothetical protein
MLLLAACALHYCGTTDCKNMHINSRSSLAETHKTKKKKERSNHIN